MLIVMILTNNCLWMDLYAYVRTYKNLLVTQDIYYHAYNILCVKQIVCSI